MTLRFLWWQKVICWLAVLFTGRAMNLYQIVKYGFLPLSAPCGDWIPIAGRWLFSIGDILQVVAFGEIFEILVMRELDKRYERRSM